MRVDDSKGVQTLMQIHDKVEGRDWLARQGWKADTGLDLPTSQRRWLESCRPEIVHGRSVKVGREWTTNEVAPNWQGGIS